MPEVQPERVVVACVVNDRYPDEAEYLFQSLGHFGGNLARAKRTAYFVKSASPEVARNLADLHANIKIVQPVSERCPHANKLQMLEDQGDFDYLVALDCDIVVARDFSVHLAGQAIAAVPALMSPLTIGQWRSLFGYFNLELPSTRYLTYCTLTETIPYFNSGVIIVPRNLVNLLREEWRSFIREIPDAFGEFPEIANYSFYTDQFALSLALARTRLPFRALPLEMNFPTRFVVHPVFEPEKLTPYLLHHYHGLSESGGLSSCSYGNVNGLIERINSRLVFARNKESPRQRDLGP